MQWLGLSSALSFYDFMASWCSPFTPPRCPFHHFGTHTLFRPSIPGHCASVLHLPRHSAAIPIGPFPYSSRSVYFPLISHVSSHPPPFQPFISPSLLSAPPPPPLGPSCQIPFTNPALCLSSSIGDIGFLTSAQTSISQSLCFFSVGPR